ncbi:MAG: type II secretion system F family protein [Candidatus Anstonellales archaeon]
MDLEKKLQILDYGMNSKAYINRALFLSFVYSVMTTIVLMAIIFLSGVTMGEMLIPLFVLIALLTFLLWYLVNIKEVDVRMELYRKAVDYEIGFLLKHMVVLLRAGIPPYNIFLLTSRGYGKSSEIMERIARKIAAGVPVSKALREEAEDVPSNYMKFVLLQIASAIDSGADLAKILEELEKQITNEKVNEYRRFGYRLNPLMLMYMLVAIIIPTLMLPIMIIILSFTGRASDLNVVHLVLLLMVVGMVQYLFYKYISFSKPRYSLFE